MFNTFGRSWELGRQSLRVLRGNKGLMVLPVISSGACAVVLASFAVPLALTVDWQAVRESKNAPAHFETPLYSVVLFAFYFVNYAVIAFFNAALVGCVMRSFDGQPDGVGEGLKIAASRFPQILGWALVSATVGMVLRAIAERIGPIGELIVWKLGFVWTIATYFVVPVLVVDGVGPLEAVRRSTGTMRKAWGESIVTHIGMGAIAFVGGLLAFVPAVVGGVLAANGRSVWPIVIGGAITVVLMIALTLVTSTLQAVLVAALYRFAATGEVPTGFEGALLEKVFRRKGERGESEI